MNTKKENNYSKAKNNLEELLASCDSLQKLSLNTIAISSNSMSSICKKNGKTLQTLNLNYFKIGQSWTLKLESLQIILNHCPNLIELNLDFTHVSEEAIQYLVENISTSTEMLSLNYVEAVLDEHVKILVNRCNKLKVRVTHTSNKVFPNIHFIQFLFNVSAKSQLIQSKVQDINPKGKLRKNQAE